MHYLNRLSMSVRRNIFLVLIGDRFKTRDNMMAFALSANVVLNPKELNTFAPILRNAISENEKFYKVYTDIKRTLSPYSSGLLPFGRHCIQGKKP